MNSTVDDYNNKNKIQLILNPELKLINRENCINNHNQRYKSEFEFSVKNKNEDEQQQQQEKQIKLIENQAKINNLRKDNFELNYTMSSSLNSNSNSNQNNTTQENYYYSIINAKTPTDFIDLNNQTTDRSRSNLLSFETNLKNHKSEIINTITTPNSDIEIIDKNNNNNNILSNIKHNIEIIKNDNNNNNKNNNNNDTFIFTRDQYDLKNTLKSNININNNNNNNIENDNKKQVQVHDLDNHKFQLNENNQFKKDIDYYSIEKNNNNNNNNNNIFNYKNEKNNNNKSTLLIKTQTINEALGKHFTQDLKDLKETIDRIDSEIDSSFKSRTLFTSPLSMDYNTNTTSRFTHQNTNTGAMFHPTWDEWKRTHMNENNNKTTINDSFKNNKQQSFTNMNKHNESETRDYKKNLLDNTNNHNLTTTKKSIIEETYTTKKSSQKQHQQFESHNEQQQLQQNQMKQKYKLSEQQDVFNPPSQILINNSSNSSQQSHHRLTSNRSPHYPVYPYDFQEQRPPSPVHLSSIVLAKEPPLEVKTQDERHKFPEPEPEPPQPVPAPEPKIKTILSTQKRKESAPNLTGWRTESDSDTEIQNRLLAKASGSIPIEYISIRRDPKPSEKKIEKNKKSITTGTNTCVERGKRIASTNTNQDEIPQYNLHVSLDSLFVKSRQEASTSTDRRNQNASTETEVRLKDACTEPEPEPKQPTPPPPPKPEPQPEQYIYRQRKSRYTEWETASNPPAETSYRLELLAKSPRTVHRREFKTYHHHHENSGGFIDFTPPIQQTRKIIYEQVRADDDDRLIFGSILNNSSHLRCVNQQYNLRSGSFPCLMPNLIDNSGTTRRYVKQTHTTNYSPFIRQEYEINMLPLAIKQSNGYMNTNVDVWNQQFSQMSQKFNEIFGQQKVQQTFIQPVETGKTQRYYKYSRTTSDNNQHMPSFGEIFNQQQNHQQYQHRIGASYNTSASTGTTAYHQDSSYQRAPIVEIPVTPNSTIGKSSRFFSSSSSYRGRANSSSGINTGPIITSLSPNTSNSNLYVSENKSTGTTGANWFSSSASSSVQKNSFEPVIRKSNYQSMSSSSASRTVRGREEEDEELVNMTNCSIDNDRQFRPIVNESNVKESFKSTSTRSTPIVVMNSNSKNSSAKKSQNYSCSSYEYSTQKI